MKPNIGNPSPFTRVALSTGYRAYRPSDLVNSSQKMAKRVRFAKGHVTIPDDIITSHSGQQDGPARGQKSPMVDDVGGIDDVGLGAGRREKEEEEGDEDGGVGLKARLGAGARPVNGVDQHSKVGSNVGRFVERGGVVVWRKEPRFRGSGRLRVLDDPVRDGERLAREGRGFARGRWRGWAEEEEAFDVWERAEQGRGVGMLRWREGERDAGFTLGDIDRREEPLMAAVVPMRQIKGAGLVKDGDVTEEQMPQPQPEDSAAASVALTEAGSDSEGDNDDGYDFLADLSLEEAEGWVPVMVADEDEGDDWMSLTGSWVMMGPQASQKSDVFALI